MLFSSWLLSVVSFGFFTCSIRVTKTTRKRNSTTTFRLNRRRGIRPPEMFAVKSMDVNSNLLRLKLDMVYHDLPAEEAQTKFEEVNTAPEAKALEPVETREIPKKPKGRKTVKGLVPKNK
jgi:hypothetical protein